MEYAENPCAAVDYEKDCHVSDAKRPKKARRGTPPKKRLRVDKAAFDNVLERLIKSKPVKRS